MKERIATLTLRGKIRFDNDELERLLPALRFNERVIVTITTGTSDFTLGLGAFVADRWLTITETHKGQCEHTKVRIELDEGE